MIGTWGIKNQFIPSQVEESRCASLKVTPRDPWTALRLAQDDDL